MYFMRYPGGKSKALTLSYDDGVEQDIHLLDLMEKYGIKGTFNLNSGLFAEEETVFPKGRVHRRLTLSRAKELYNSEMCEVAGHAFTHPFLEKMNVDSALWEVAHDRYSLEQIFERRVQGFAYPFGTYNDDVVNALKTSGINMHARRFHLIISMCRQTGFALPPPATTMTKCSLSLQKNL